MAPLRKSSARELMALKRRDRPGSTSLARATKGCARAAVLKEADVVVLAHLKGPFERVMVAPEEGNNWIQLTD